MSNRYDLHDQLVRKEFLRISDELSDSCKKGVLSWFSFSPLLYRFDGFNGPPRSKFSRDSGGRIVGYVSSLRDAINALKADGQPSVQPE